MKKTVTGVVVPVTGAPFVREFSELADYQSAVGGYIELVPGISEDHDVVGLANEDGFSLKLPVNRIASWLTRGHIVGDFVLIGDGDGDFTDLPQVVIDALVVAR